jgi:hypothetical protein
MGFSKKTPEERAAKQERRAAEQARTLELVAAQRARAAGQEGRKAELAAAAHVESKRKGFLATPPDKRSKHSIAATRSSNAASTC